VLAATFCAASGVSPMDQGPPAGSSGKSAGLILLEFYSNRFRQAKA